MLLSVIIVVFAWSLWLSRRGNIKQKLTTIVSVNYKYLTRLYGQYTVSPDSSPVRNTFHYTVDTISHVYLYLTLDIRASVIIQPCIVHNVTPRLVPTSQPHGQLLSMLSRTTSRHFVRFILLAFLLDSCSVT